MTELSSEEPVDEIGAYRDKKRSVIKLVDKESGEILECPNCQTYEAQLSGAETEIRAWRRRYANLKADKEAEVRNHALFPRAMQTFDLWREATGHTRSQWNIERFWDCVPALKKYDDYTIGRAIAGLSYDPFTKKRKNGSLERFDTWETLFRRVANVEFYANRAPKDYAPVPRATYTEQAKEVAGFLLERARLIEEAKDGVVVARLFTEIDRKTHRWLEQGGVSS